MNRPDVLLIPCGEVLSPEHLELGYFAASIVGVPPEELRLAHLVAFLRAHGREVEHPRTRRSDLDPLQRRVVSR